MANPSIYRLVIYHYHHDKTEIRNQKLSAGEYMVGRGNDCEIKLEIDQTVSRRHCLLAIYCDGSITIQDAGSKNGTYLDEKKLTPFIQYGVNPSQEVKIAHFHLHFYPLET